jgi:hypothetical protein
MTSMKKRMSLVALLALALGAGSTPAYATSDPEPVQPFVPGINEDPALSKAWQRWQAKEIDDYVITVRLSCFCVKKKPVRTIIRGDRTVRVTKGDRSLAPARGYSMDEMFSMIRDANAEADHVTVDYSGRGIPTSIGIDPSEMIADEETYYTISLSRL